jgi:hypothetical protein
MLLEISAIAALGNSIFHFLSDINPDFTASSSREFFATFRRVARALEQKANILSQKQGITEG